MSLGAGVLQAVGIALHGPPVSPQRINQQHHGDQKNRVRDRQRDNFQGQEVVNLQLLVPLPVGHVHCNVS